MTRSTHPPLTIIGTAEACLDGQVVPYCIKRSSTAYRARLEIRADTGLTVVLPRDYRPQDVPDLLQKKKRWVLNKLKATASVPVPPPKGIRDGDTIPYLGSGLVVCEASEVGWQGVRLDGNRLIVSLRQPADGALGALVEGWCRAQALNIIERKVEDLAKVLDVSYKRIAVRQQRTRWGSCSVKGCLSFNWKLLMAPEPVIDYVVIHELAHLKEMNHGKRFWQVVAQYCPDWSSCKKWLRDHGPELTARAPNGRF